MDVVAVADVAVVCLLVYQCGLANATKFALEKRRGSFFFGGGALCNHI